MMTILCMVIAWGFLAWMGWIAVMSLSQGCGYLKKIHQIPCSNCSFHTQCPALKCTVHPHHALTEAALYCPDFESTSF